MRRIVACLSMALAVTAAGAARANDATQVIYDLSAFGGGSPAPATENTATDLLQVPMGSLPLYTPSSDQRRREGDLLSDEAGNMEIRTPAHGGRPHGEGVSSPRGGKGDGGAGDNGPAPTPNPEPGTLLLLGSGLAAGARFVRRRPAA